MGIGAREDDYEALAWYRRAAEQGNADAQYALGTLHAETKSSLRDPVEACRWLTIASRASYPNARRALLSVERKLSQRDLDDCRKLAEDWMTRRAKPAPQPGPK
jgi:TPR repeat protein